MRENNEHVRARVERLQRVECSAMSDGILDHRSGSLVERCGAKRSRARVNALEDRARADRHSSRVFERGWRDVVGEGHERRRAELATVVCGVPREEHELVRGCARESHDVIRRVSGCFEEVE